MRHPRSAPASPDYRLRGITFFDAMSRETPAYRAELVAGERVAAVASNDGSGGPDRLDWTDHAECEAFEAACAVAFPSEPVGWAAERYMSDLLDAAIMGAASDAERWAEAHGYVAPDGTLRHLNEDGMPIWDAILFDQRRERRDVSVNGQPACLHEFADGSGILRVGNDCAFVTGEGS